MSAPQPTSTTFVSQAPRDAGITTPTSASIAGPAPTRKAMMAPMDPNPFRALAGVTNITPSHPQALEQPLFRTILWCNTSQPSSDAPVAQYRILSFRSSGRNVYLLLDCRQENQASLKYIHDALCDSTEAGGLNHHCDDDGKRCEGGTVSIKWVSAEEISDSFSTELSVEEQKTQFEKSAVFSHADALRKIRDLPPKNIIMVNGVLDLTKIQATLHKEKQSSAKNKEKPLDREMLGMPGICIECGRRCSPIYWVLTDIHEYLNANSPVHKPGFAPTYDPKARWICLFWSYEGNGRDTWLIDAREANKTVLKLLWEKKPEEQDDYPHHWIPSTWGEDEKGVDEAQIHHELLKLKAPWRFEPRLVAIRGELDLDAFKKYFEENPSANTCDAVDDVPVKPGTEAWPQQE